MSSSNSARHSLPQQVTHQLSEHEILLSFDSDEDALRFDEWWDLVGFEAFGEWIDEGCPG